MYKENNKEYLWLLLFLIPFALSTAAVFTGILWGILSVGTVVILLILLNPMFRKSENVWTFVMIAVCYTPINIAIVYNILSLGVFSYGWRITEILWAVMCYYVAFSIEELVFGFFVRLIRKRQYRSDDI